MPSDVAFLRKYGVRTVLDLRGDQEVSDQPDAFLGSDVVTANISPFMVNVASTNMQAATTVAWVYDAMFENIDAWRGIFEFISAAPEGCVLFHCAVGKDRTGILATLILLLCGCDRWDALASYVPSRVNLMRLPFFQRYWDKDCTDSEREHYDSRASTLERWLDCLDAEYGGSAEAYLKHCGISAGTRDAVRLRLVG